MRHIFCLAVAALFIFASCGDKKTETPTAAKETIDTTIHGASLPISERRAMDALPEGVSPIDADSLDAEYSRDPDRADRKYKDKWIYVSGRIKNIHRNDVFGISSISLRVGTGIFGHVLCTSHDTVFVSGHQKKEDVIIKGKCAGTVLTHVQLRECVNIPIVF